MNLNFFNGKITKIIVIKCALLFSISILFARYLDINLFNELSVKSFMSPDFKIYTIITHMFMHGSYGHLAGNMLFLFFFGIITERFMKWYKYFFFFILSGLGSYFIHNLLTGYSLVQYNTGMLGASGAIFGLIGGACALNNNLNIIKNKVFTFKPIHLLILLLLIELCMSLFVPSNVANWAHLGGGLTGFVLAKFIKWFKK